MTPDEFTVALAGELRLRGVPYLFTEVAEFVADCWPLIADDQSPSRWANRFTECREPVTADRGMLTPAAIAEPPSEKCGLGRYRVA